MSSSKEYLDYVLDQLSGLQDITYRSMMEEFIIYYKDRIVGGIYNNRFLIKPVKSAVKLMAEASYELPITKKKRKANK